MCRKQIVCQLINFHPSVRNHIFMTNEQTVYIVDDDAAARSSLATLAKSLGYNEQTFASAEEFLSLYQCEQPGCLIADIRMLEMSGLELQRKLLETDCPLPVIIISAYANAPLAVQAMKHGAVNVLEKPCRPAELADNIRRAIELDAKRRRERSDLQTLKKRLDSLSDDERRVLDAMVAGKANKVIARELNVGLRTVEARRHNIFEKMHADSLAELIKMVVAIEGGPKA
jgi:FixJ family two-component response regulator